MKKYFSYISIIYFLIIFYVVLTDKLGNVLAPIMQPNIIIGGIVLLLMGVISLFGHGHYKFKIFDLILIVPLFMIFLAGNFRINTNLASNRNQYSARKVIKNNEKFTKEVIINKDEKVDIEITDDIYLAATNLFSFGDQYDKYMGKVVKIKGFAQKDQEFVTPGYFAIGKYAITCCVADSSFIGILVDYDLSKINNNDWYEVTGKLYKTKDKYGYTTLAIKAIDVKNVEQERDIYVYPCYDGACLNKIKKYDLQTEIG